MKQPRKGHFYFVPVYYNQKTEILSGRGLASNLFLDFMLGVHHLFLFFTTNILSIDIEPGYPISLEKEGSPPTERS